MGLEYRTVLGDWWDMPSLSVFNSKQKSEGLRIKDDIKAGCDAMDSFMAIINNGFRPRSRPRLVFTHGNHSMAVRLPRFFKEYPHLEWD